MGHFFRWVKLASLILFKLLIRKWRVFLSIFLIGLISFFLIAIAKPFKTTSISEGIIGTYQTHNLPENVTFLLSKSLVKPDEAGRMLGELAVGWDVNSDATVFTFKLKNNSWSDGTKIKSSDLVFNIPDVLVNYPDDQTIQFKLKDSFSAFPSLLTNPVFKTGTLIGTGPYKVEKIEKSRIFITKLILRRVNPTIDTVPEMVIRFYPNEKIAHLAFELGEVQSLLGVSNISLYTSSKLYKLEQKTNYQRIVSILYNTKDPALSNRSLRQALGYYAPEIKDEILAKTPIQPYSWAYTDDVNDFLSNSKAAEAALTRAKSSASDEILKREIVLTSSPQLEAVGKQIITAWNSSGIKAILRIESGIPQNFQALLISENIPSDPDQYSLWHSTQTKTNLGQYSSARVDKDLEDGRKLQKEDERKIRYIDFQQTLSEDAPATFLYFPKYNIAYLKKIENYLKAVLALQLPGLEFN